MVSSSRRVRGISVVLATLGVLSLAAQPVGASVPKFGAKLAAGIDPSNSPELCDHELNGGSATYSCTWILNQAYGGGAVTAPMDGKILAVRLISWSNGSLTPFVARKSGGQFKVVSKGSKISYGDTCNPSCSIQKYSTSGMTVHTGDYLGVMGANMGPLRCDSGGTRTYLFTPPLVVGGGLHTPSGSSGCFLMVQFLYG